MADELRPIQVGDELHGYCGGYFGRDAYDCGIVEAVGYDWVVKRRYNPYNTPGADVATGPGILQLLAEHRTPRPDGCDNQWGECRLRRNG